MSKFIIALSLLFSTITCAFAQATSADVGLVNSMQGDVSYQGKEGPAKKVQPYMRLRHISSHSFSGQEWDAWELR